ncbi:MAG TPA: hypothetical protein VF785_08605 [Gemmatimonadaceae bacterium]
MSDVPDVSNYTLVAIAVSAVLLLGIRPGAWGFLRFILAVHLIGDVAFGWIWTVMPTYAFMKYIDDGDRIYAAIFLAVAVMLTDVTYRAASWVRHFIANARLSAQRPAVAAQSTVDDGWFSSAFLVAGLVCKLIFLGATGVLTGTRALSDLRPSDSIGLGAIVLLGDFLVPYGVAAIRRAGRAPWPVVGDLLLLAAISFLSFSKAAFITYAVIYGVAYVLAEGTKRTRKEFLNWKSLLIVAMSFLVLGIKSQQRAGMLLDLSSSTMTEQAVAGASARFMGGIFRAYTVAVREIRHGWPPLGGSYHAQAAALIVPRAIWPDKPHVASEQLYYMLGVTEETYGTAFAINAYGCLVFDFGLAGCLVGAGILGLLLQLGDSQIPSWRELRAPSRRGQRWHYLATAWLYIAVQLSEGGIPIAIVCLVSFVSVYVLIQSVNRVVHGVLVAASSGSRELAA